MQDKKFPLGMTDAGPSTSSNSTQPEENVGGGNFHPAVWQRNLQKIQQCKQQVYNWPHTKKLLKLAIYSACQTEGCKCSGWKAPAPPPKNSKDDVTQPLANFNDPCHNCTHILGQHMTHLKSLQEEEVNRLLGMVVDVEIIFMNMHREEDPDTKKVYYYLFKLLRRCIVEMTKPTIEGPLGQPPFERPSIAKAITNFVLYKFSHAAAREWQTMYNRAKMLLHCLNHWNFEIPSARKQTVSAEEISAYKVNYTRWLVFCHLPFFFDSLQHFETTLVFGRTLLRAVFHSVRRQLMDECHSGCARMPPEKRVLILTKISKFLQLVEEEIYLPNSPIWDPEFKQVPPQHLQALPDSKESPVMRSPGQFEKLNVPPNDKDTFTTVNLTLGVRKEDVHGDSEKHRESTGRSPEVKRKKLDGEMAEDVSHEKVVEIIASISDNQQTNTCDVSSFDCTSGHQDITENKISNSHCEEDSETDIEELYVHISKPVKRKIAENQNDKKRPQRLRRPSVESFASASTQVNLQLNRHRTPTPILAFCRDLEVDISEIFPNEKLYAAIKHSISNKLYYGKQQIFGSWQDNTIPQSSNCNSSEAFASSSTSQSICTSLQKEIHEIHPAVSIYCKDLEMDLNTIFSNQTLYAFIKHEITEIIYKAKQEMFKLEQTIKDIETVSVVRKPQIITIKNGPVSPESSASPSLIENTPSYPATPSSSNYRSTSPSHRPASPSYRSASPSYRPASPNHRPASPSYRSASPSYRPASPDYCPASPSYRSASPSNSQSDVASSCPSPLFQPNYSPSSQAFSPMPLYSQSSPSFKNALRIEPDPEEDVSLRIERLLFSCDTCNSYTELCHFCPSCEESKCSSCEKKGIHPHVMKKRGVGLDKDFFDIKAKSGAVDYEVAVKKFLVRFMQSVLHTVNCSTKNCSSSGCDKMKLLIMHFIQCSNRQNCRVCVRLRAICCNNRSQMAGGCPGPFCFEDLEKKKAGTLAISSLESLQTRLTQTLAIFRERLTKGQSVMACCVCKSTLNNQERPTLCQSEGAHLVCADCVTANSSIRTNTCVLCGAPRDETFGLGYETIFKWRAVK